MPTAPLPLLYSYRRCPYAMRARMALLVVGVAFDAHEIVLRDKPAAMLALSPKGTVPVLALPDGRVLEQSLDIVQWAFMAHGDPVGWWARAQSAENLALLSACDGPFKHHLDRTKYLERFAGEDHLLHREQAVAVLLAPLDARLARAEHLGGQTPCATDMAIFPFVRQFAAIDPPWFAQLPLPSLRRWWAHWLAHPLFDAAMVKLPVDEVVRFPRAWPEPS
ncbi:glutathione S-transferase [Hydrogenophaga sp. BPS33]|uniref:glutathione S-transferase n=1 Tax=Hydrogenophaga sp. BPS33 TaxID=2651974 RepID=UPI001320423F|nr:glutathione S-transferase [Hydrogenophaga sp. BPS33]QHE88475.1 glutathione S-transferase [Hydrogenophaga sp. BPS33]